MDPPGGQVADPPNRQGFASNSPHSSACQQLSCSPPPFPAPPKMRPKPTCPIPNPCQHGRAFCSSPPQIFCPRPKPHVSPLVGLLASTQIWSVVIYSAWSNVYTRAGEFPKPTILDGSPSGSLCPMWDPPKSVALKWCDVQMRSTCLSVAEASWESCGQRHSCLKDQTGVNSSFFSPFHR